MAWDRRYDNLPTEREELHTCSNCHELYTLRFVVVPTKPYERLTVDPTSLGKHPYFCNPTPPADTENE